MAKIDCVEDLPDWFDLNNYNGLEDFNAIDWVYQLSRRAKLLYAHPDYSFEVKKKCSEEYKSSLFFWRVLNSGKADDLRREPMAPPQFQGVPKRILSTSWSPIRNVSLLDLRCQLDRDSIAELEGKAHKLMVERWKLLDLNVVKLPGYCEAEGVNPNLKLGLRLTTYDGNPNEGHVISVDLSATDSVLVEAFEAWLKKTRAKELHAGNQLSKRNRPAYKDWARYGLLPYLDLLIWAEETGNHIPRRVFSEAVSSYDRGESAFSKAVVVVAKALMTDLSELQALASTESYAKTQ